MFGVSNSAKVIEGGLQLGVVNLDKVAANVDGFAFACVDGLSARKTRYISQAYVRTGTRR